MAEEITKREPLPFHTYKSDGDIPELSLPELMEATSDLLASNGEWNLTGRGIGEEMASTKDTPYVARILAELEKAQAAYQKNDFAGIMEHVFTARLVLESHPSETNVFTNSSRTYGVAMLLRRILKRLSGSCLDYAGALHNKTQGLPGNLTLQ